MALRGVTMKIYQLHEYSGEWEDFRDYIIGSYLTKERAEEEKVRAELREKELSEHSAKCARCPFLEFENSWSDIDRLLSEHQYYCTEAKLEDTDYGINCLNYYSKWDDSTFKVKEVEVEE